MIPCVTPQDCPARGVVVQGFAALWRAVDWPPEAWTALATVAIAAFTLVLAVVTYVQAALTRTAAEAAKASAEALPNIERAYLFVILRDYHCEPDAHYLGPDSRTRAHGGKFSGIFAFRNHGKTPAIIHEIRVGTQRSANPLDPTEWAAQGNLLSREYVIASGDETQDFDVTEKDWLSVSEGDSVVAGGLFIYFFGCTTYSDVFGETHETQFCFRYERNRLNQWGGREHNRRT